MKRFITVCATFEVYDIDDVRRISKLCSKDDDFVCLGLSGISDQDFDKLKKYIDEKELPI